MRPYIDDDSVDPSLIRLLRRDGHVVQIPADVGLARRSDQAHLAHAIRDRRAMLTRNSDDFEDLHDLVTFAANGHQGGILVVLVDANPRNDNDARQHRPRRPQSRKRGHRRWRPVSRVEPLAIRPTPDTPCSDAGQPADLHAGVAAPRLPESGFLGPSCGEALRLPARRRQHPRHGTALLAVSEMRCRAGRKPLFLES